MNIVQEFEQKRSCEIGLCDGSGIISVPDGDADFDQDFCSCEAGEELQREASRAEEYDQYDHFPLSGSAVLDWFNSSSPYGI